MGMSCSIDSTKRFNKKMELPFTKLLKAKEANVSKCRYVLKDGFVAAI